MKGLLYLLAVLLVVGMWFIWQVVRRASAGAQAVINPERYAVQKVVTMQEEWAIRNPPSEQPAQLATSSSFPAEKWQALVRYDPEISKAAEKLQAYGDHWIEKFGRDYFALQEDRTYIVRIVGKLLEDAESEAKKQAIEAERQRSWQWANAFSYTNSGEPCSEQSLEILRLAQTQGYLLSIDSAKTISVTKGGSGTSYLRSNSDIQRFGKFAGLSP